MVLINCYIYLCTSFLLLQDTDKESNPKKAIMSMIWLVAEDVDMDEIEDEKLKVKFDPDGIDDVL